MTSCTVGSYKMYDLLRELPKKDYVNFHQNCGSGFDISDLDQDIYVDLKTKKLWERTGESFKADEFEQRAIELELENEVDIDKEPSRDLINLKIMKDTLVEWWCK